MNVIKEPFTYFEKPLVHATWKFLLRLSFLSAGAEIDSDKTFKS